MYHTTLRTNKKCFVCGELMTAGTPVYGFTHTKEKYYPVKGNMKFTTYYFVHESCKDKVNNH